MSIYLQEWRSHCTFIGIRLCVKLMEIGADFRHNDRTSEDIGNRRLPLDYQRLIGLHTSQNDVLILVLQPFVIGLKKTVGIGADFGYYCTTSGDMANRRSPLHSRRPLGLYTS